MPKDLLTKFFRFLLFDEVRLLEVFSALNLLAWFEVLLTAPELLHDGAYRGFSNVEAVVWAYCFGTIALGQIVAMIVWRWHPLDLRFAAMAFAAGAWTVIAWNVECDCANANGEIAACGFGTLILNDVGVWVNVY